MDKSQLPVLPVAVDRQRRNSIDTRHCNRTLGTDTYRDSLAEDKSVGLRQGHRMARAAVAPRAGLELLALGQWEGNSVVLFSAKALAGNDPSSVS